jgi:hypothetical protein
MLSQEVVLCRKGTRKEATESGYVLKEGMQTRQAVLAVLQVEEA